MRLAALGVSYESVGNMLGFAKSTLCKWPNQEQYKRPKLSGDVLELDGIRTRIASGNVELKVARDDRGVALASVGRWEDSLTIESAIDMAYGRDAPHQLGQFHPLRECKRNIGGVGLAEAKALLESYDM